MAIGRYLMNILLALDRLCMAILRGDPSETLSSCSYRMYRDRRFWGFLRPVIDKIFFLQRSHCENAYFDDRHQQLPD